MLLKSEIVKRGAYKCRTLETLAIKRPTTYNNLVYIQTPISKLQGKCKPKIYNRYTKIRKSNPNTTQDSHQTTGEENKRKRKEKKTNKTNPEQLIKWQ